MDTSSPPAAPGWPFKRYFWISIAFAVVLGALVLRVGFMPDDFIWLGVWDHVPPPAPLGNTPLDVYRTATGIPEHTLRLAHVGVFPWWVEPSVRVAFFRPLGSLLYGLDHLLYNRVAVAYQMHSVLWYVGMVVLAGVLLKRVLPTAVAGVAMFLFAIWGSHSAVLGWLSYRSVVMSLLFGILGIYFHVKWREEKRTGSLVGALVSFALALLCGETMVILSPYVLAYEAFSGPGQAKDKLKGLIPFGVLMAGYFALYRALGYGAGGSDMYLDAVGTPVDWFKAMLTRVPAAIAGLTLNAPPDFIFDQSMVPLFTVLGAVGLTLFALLVWGVWPRLEAAERRTVGWMLTGAFVSTWLANSAFAGSRTLIVPSLGMAVGLAVVLRHAWRGRARTFRAGAVLAGAAVLALVHVVGAPYIWWQTTEAYAQADALMARVQMRYEEALDESKLPEQRLVVLNAPNGIIGIYGSVRWWSTGMPLPKAWWVLSYSINEQKVTRTGPNSLELSFTKGGHFLDSVEERIHRAARHPVAQGQEFDMKGLKVRIEEMDGQFPTRISYTFDVPLEDPSLKLVQWQNKKVVPYIPPPVGGPPSALNVR
ncbi:hypothetical protein [Corallococcus exercitus]|uniref:Glycosyltransferase RgtA/B/C/D-like domain-containing protein n=1 Tax=Corallococcus exercitus TaxID=2316736 RepID=A0A7Y4NPK0_9BACT|nr:hypothetical protein [Corallococcus exercitus]NOK31746.1 hypothetical protein [Corallococcus exercitus]